MDGRVEMLERRVEAHDVEIRSLTKQVGEFVGAVKLLAFILSASTLVSLFAFLAQLLHLPR